MANPWIRYLDIRIEEDVPRRQLKVTLDRHQPSAVVDRKELGITAVAIESWDALQAMVVSCAASQAAADQARGEACRLRWRITDLEAELVGWQDTVSEWKDATGLTRGGDPGGVEPEHLRAFIQKASRLELAVRAWAAKGVGKIHESVLTAEETELLAALAALPPQDG